jgi:hypothetical protein
MIEWLQQWYIEQCNGDWEHEFGISIETIDNPGWLVSIDLSNTKLENLEIPYTVKEKSDTDWLGYSIANKIFKGVGDPKKLSEIGSVIN